MEKKLGEWGGRGEKGAVKFQDVLNYGNHNQVPVLWDLSFGRKQRLATFRTGSCVLKGSMVECRLIPLIDTLYWHLNRYSIDISWNWYSVDTQSMFDQQLIVSWLSVNQLICSYRNLVDCWPRCRCSVDWVLIECQSRVSNECWTTVLIECRSRIKVSIKCWSRISINTQPWMPLVYIIFRTCMLGHPVSKEVLSPMS